MEWPQFEANLALALRALTPRCVLVVAAHERGGYVQFHVTDQRLSAEASGPKYTEGPAQHAADDATMLASGWAEPTPSQPNWTSELPLPALTTEYAALAGRCVVALRDVFHLEAPQVLSYRAWREPETQPPGVTWEPERFDQLDPGEDPLLLPMLGLLVEQG